MSSFICRCSIFLEAKRLGDSTRGQYHPYSLLDTGLIFHLCLRTSGPEASSRLAALDYLLQFILTSVRVCPEYNVRRVSWMCWGGTASCAGISWNLQLWDNLQLGNNLKIGSITPSVGPHFVTQLVIEWEAWETNGRKRELSWIDPFNCLYSINNKLFMGNNGTKNSTQWLLYPISLSNENLYSCPDTRFHF